MGPVGGPGVTKDREEPKHVAQPNCGASVSPSHCGHYCVGREKGRPVAMVCHAMMYAFCFGVYGVAQGADEAEDLDDDGVGCEKCISLACCPLSLVYIALIVVGAVLEIPACLWVGVGLLADWLVLVIAIVRHSPWGNRSSPLAAFREWGEDIPPSRTELTAMAKEKADEAAGMAAELGGGRGRARTVA